jgi:hypothetical protein
MPTTSNKKNDKFLTKSLIFLKVASLSHSINIIMKNTEEGARSDLTNKYAKYARKQKESLQATCLLPPLSSHFGLAQVNHHCAFYSQLLPAEPSQTQESFVKL